MYGVQQVLIHADSEIRAILEFICEEANKLANCGLYYCRQMLFKAGAIRQEIPPGFSDEKSSTFSILAVMLRSTITS
jgi:hypothetical protein